MFSIGSSFRYRFSPVPIEQLLRRCRRVIFGRSARVRCLLGERSNMGLSRFSPNRHGGGSVVIFVEKGGDKYAVQNWRETRQGCLQVRILRYVSPIRRQHRHASTLPKVHRGNLYEDFLATLGSDASGRGLIQFCTHPQRHDHNRQMKHRRYTQGTHRILQ